MEVLVFAAIVGFILATISQRKGYGFALWWVFGTVSMLGIFKATELLAALAVLLALLLALFGLFLALHLHPLTEEQVSSLAKQRRQSYLAKYFQFSPGEVSVDRAFKASLAPAGQFYSVFQPLQEWPRIAAALLKGKKHEWIIAAFERERHVVLAWVNKGPNNLTVPLRLPLDVILTRARLSGCSSVLISHNHPNPSPRHYDCSSPSSNDVNSARELQDILCAGGLNFVEFVCERGRFYEYWRADCPNFAPPTNFVKGIRQRNGLSKWANLRLHWERLFHTSNVELWEAMPHADEAAPLTAVSGDVIKTDNAGVANGVDQAAYCETREDRSVMAGTPKAKAILEAWLDLYGIGAARVLFVAGTGFAAFLLAVWAINSM